MTTYKLFRIRDGKLYPMFVDSRKEMKSRKWLKAEVGELVDEGHVKSRLGPLALRPGFHSTEVPFMDWIGKRGPDGSLLQNPDTVWCECEVEGKQESPGRKKREKDDAVRLVLFPHKAGSAISLDHFKQNLYQTTSWTCRGGTDLPGAWSQGTARMGGGGISYGKQDLCGRERRRGTG